MAKVHVLKGFRWRTENLIPGEIGSPIKLHPECSFRWEGRGIPESLLVQNVEFLENCSNVLTSHGCSPEICIAQAKPINNFILLLQLPDLQPGTLLVCFLDLLGTSLLSSIRHHGRARPLDALSLGTPHHGGTHFPNSHLRDSCSCLDTLSRQNHMHLSIRIRWHLALARRPCHHYRKPLQEDYSYKMHCMIMNVTEKDERIAHDKSSVHMDAHGTITSLVSQGNCNGGTGFDIEHTNQCLHPNNPNVGCSWTVPIFGIVLGLKRFEMDEIWKWKFCDIIIYHNVSKCIIM